MPFPILLTWFFFPQPVQAHSFCGTHGTTGVEVGESAMIDTQASVVASAEEVSCGTWLRESLSSNKLLNVLTLTPFYPSLQDDGEGCFIAEPLQCLEPHGIRSSVLAVRPVYRGRAYQNPDIYPAAWMRYLALPSGMGLPTSGRCLYSRVRRAVLQRHAREPLHLIHAHAALPCGHAALLLARELGIPYVVSVHGRDAFSSRQVGGVAGQWCRRMSREVYRSAKNVICVSRKVREEVNAGVECRTSIVYNGVNTDNFFPAAVGAGGDPVVLSIGNLIPTKGHDVLLRAFAEVHDSHPQARCKFIGTGPEQGRMVKLAEELGIRHCVEFMGRQSRESVADALQGCAVFALASSYEALGCVYLEAMATGKPVIACRGQGIGEVIENGVNGILVEADNPSTMADALRSLLRDADLRSRMGMAARRTVVENFTLAHQAEHLARIYQECAQ